MGISSITINFNGDNNIGSNNGGGEDRQAKELLAALGALLKALGNDSPSDDKLMDELRDILKALEHKDEEEDPLEQLKNMLGLNDDGGDQGQGSDALKNLLKVIGGLKNLGVSDQGIMDILSKVLGGGSGGGGEST